MSDDRIAKVQAAFEKARNGKGLFGSDVDLRKDVLETTQNYFAPLLWLWKLVSRP